MNKSLKIYLLFFVFALIFGCKLQAPISSPKLLSKPLNFQTHLTWQDSVMQNTSWGNINQDSLSSGNLNYKQYFNDTTLIALIDTALKYNFDVRQALQRLRVAKSNSMYFKGALYPSFMPTASTGVDRYGYYTQNAIGNYYNNLTPGLKPGDIVPNPVTDNFIGIRSSWEPDLWGKLHSLKDAALHRFLASDATRQKVNTVVVAEVSSQYYNLLTIDNEIEILRRNLAIQANEVTVVQNQKNGGRATELAVLQSVAQYNRTRSLEFEVRQRLLESENNLNLLLGAYPKVIKRGQSLDNQILPKQLNTGLPTNALRNRPDVRQAEEEMFATKRDADAAYAALFPSLNLTPYFGLNAFTPGNLFALPASLTLGIIGGLSTPLINRYRVKADYESAKATYGQAFLNYEKVTLNSYNEVVNSYNRIENYNQAASWRSKEVVALTNAITASTDLYMGGYANYLEIITAQRSLLEAEINLAQIRKETLLSTVYFYQALGGGK